MFEQPLRRIAIISVAHRLGTVRANRVSKLGWFENSEFEDNIFNLHPSRGLNQRSLTAAAHRQKRVGPRRRGIEDFDIGLQLNTQYDALVDQLARWCFINRQPHETLERRRVTAKGNDYTLVRLSDPGVNLGKESTSCFTRYEVPERATDHPLRGEFRGRSPE